MKAGGITNDGERMNAFIGMKAPATGGLSALNKEQSASLAQIPNSQRFSKVRPMTGKAPDVTSSFVGVTNAIKQSAIEYTPMGVLAAGGIPGEPHQFGQLGTRYRNHTKQQS